MQFEKIKVHPDFPLFNINEIKIIRLICQQRSSAEIAEKLGLSARTIDGYRMGLLRKTKTKNLVGIAIYAVRKGIYKHK